MTNAESTELTKENITLALFKLMKEKDYGAIKITEIAKAAGYGRATVYRHFQTKEEMIRYYFNRHVSDFEDIKTVRLYNEDDYYEIIFRIFSTLKSTKENIMLLINSHLDFLYLEFLNEAMVENFKINNFKNTRYSPFYFAGSLFNVSMEWLRNDCDESVKQLSELYLSHLFTTATTQSS